jgi:hypothetical protein
VVVLAILVGFAALPTGRVDAARQKMAVLGVEPRDDGDARSQQRTAALARALTEAARQRAEMPATGYELAAGSQKDLLELKLLSDCIDEAPECMAAIGRDLGADVLIFGNIERKPGGDYSIWVRSLVVGSKKAGGHNLVKTIPADEATDENMRRLAISLFPETASGRVPPPVDPVRPPVSSKPLGADVPAPDELEPTGEAPGKTARVLFWTSLVTTGVGVAAFTITGLQVRSIEKEQDDALAKFNFAANGVQHPNDACAEAASDGFAELQDICDRGKRMATITNVLIGVSAAAAVATAIFYWRGYLIPSHASERTARRSKLMIGPELYPTGAGLGAVMQF